MEADIGLKHIRVLTCLYKEKSLKQCARRLGKTPSAISKSLSKLRELYDDPLFITTATGTEPTARLLEMIDDLSAIQLTLENTLANSKAFEPLAYTGDIVLSCSMALVERFGSELFATLSSLAPNAHIILHTWTNETTSQLETGQVTAALHMLSEEKPQHIHQQRLFIDEMVLAVRADHPAQNLEDALRYPAIIMKTVGWNDQRYRFLDNLKKNGIEIQRGGMVDQLSLGLKLIRTSDMSMFIPTVVATPDLKYFKFERELHMSLRFVYCIKSANRNSPLHIWLRDVCSSVVSQSIGDD
ncbi:LysR family transcriptional regulator [Vibrio sinaloensis]|uniref:LysR family transcriptional regulator n=1 Tax=Photobacterium sp. (strain ATCC 43367) TaxID=379097 RepID=UPI00205571F3|nr:LysR family transcriptional regulator [Vibrio sinaloensis]UPQ89802.1 LysR family transcriptional regulator [Vibrio sinaloensis]